MKVFICHASEDKVPFVELLVSGLGHLDYFYDVYSLQIGDDITSVINEEIDKSSSAIIVISSDFLKKNYPRNELRLIINKKMSCEDYKIFPIYLDDVSELTYKDFPMLKSLWGVKGNRNKFSADVISSQILDKMQVRILPKNQESLEISVEELVKNLEVVKDWNEVISKRFGIGYRFMTLKEIGDELGVTRERIRQKQEVAERELKERCLRNDYLKKITDSIFLKIISIEGVSIVTLKDIFSVIKYKSNEDLMIKQIVKLILSIHGFEELKNLHDTNNIFIKSEGESSELSADLDKIIKYLRYDYTLPIEMGEIIKKLQLSSSLNVLEKLLSVFDFIVLEDGLYSVAFYKLGKLSAMAERILFSANRPIKVGGIIEEIRLKSLQDQEILDKLNRRLLIQQMSSEKKRFFTNKKGFWCLSDNKHMVKSYREILIDIFKKYNYPIEKKIIIEEINKLNIENRGKRSMVAYLSGTKEVIRLEVKEDITKTQYYILSGQSYDEERFIQKAKIDNVKSRDAKTLKKAKIKINEYFLSRKSEEVYLKDLALYLQKKLKLKRLEPAYGYISKSDMVRNVGNNSRDIVVKLK